jgi:hypothetical protein
MVAKHIMMAYEDPARLVVVVREIQQDLAVGQEEPLTIDGYLNLLRRTAHRLLAGEPSAG